MAAFQISELPSHINTYERLAVWAAMSLQSAANGLQVNVVAGGGQAPAVQVQNAVTADNQNRFVVAMYLPVDQDALNSSTEKTWMATKEITSSAPGANLLTN